MVDASEDGRPVNKSSGPNAVLLLLLAFVAAIVVWGVWFRDPGPKTTIRVRVLVAEARAAGLIAEDTDAEAVVTNTARVLADRLEVLGATRVDFVVDGNEVVLEAFGLDDDDQDAAATVVTAWGEIQFQIEVLPDDRYPRPADSSPVRTGLWSGTAAEFDAFKATEVERWRTAREQNPLAAYGPQDARHRVVRNQGTDGTTDADFRLVEVQTDAVQTIDGGILRNPRVAQDSRGMPVVILDVQSEFQHLLHEFTSANIGLPLAIVLNGECVSAPVIREALSDSIQISLGNAPWGEAAREARALVTALRAGSLRVPVEFVSIETGAPE